MYVKVSENFPPGTPICEDGEIQLINGMVPSEGTILICVDGVWGSVCDFGFDANAAAVVCRSLGFLGGQCICMYIHVCS